MTIKRSLHLTDETLDQIDFMIDELSAYRQSKKIDININEIEILAAFKSNIDALYESALQSHDVGQDVII